MATAFRSGTLGLIQHLFDEGTCTGLSDARSAGAVRHRRRRVRVRRAGGAARGAGAEHLPGRVEGPGRRRGRVPGHVRAALPQGRVDPRPRRPGCLAAPGRLPDRAPGPVRRRPTPRRREGRRRPAGRRGPGAATTSAAVLHEEIERLPERFRLPVVLCYLEGMTRDQAADYLRCTEGSVRGRLAKGRELLRRPPRPPRHHPRRALPVPRGDPGKPRRDDRPRRGRRGIGLGRGDRRGGLARVVAGPAQGRWRSSR